MNGIYHVLGTLLAFALFFEMTISWWMDMQVESPEQKLKRLKAEDDQKKAKEDAKNWIKNRPRI
jgi:HAMP domain-containing protein